MSIYIWINYNYNMMFYRNRKKEHNISSLSTKLDDVSNVNLVIC